MIRHIWIVIMFLMSGVAMASGNGNSFPSPEGKSKEQILKEIQEFKLKYLAQEMDLTEEQQPKFFKLYDEMCRKRWEVMKNAKKIEKRVKHNSNATEADYQAASEALTKARAEDAAIEKEYDAKFSKFLSQKQLYKLKKAEDDFRQKMEKMRHSKQKKSGKHKNSKGSKN